MDLRFTDNSHKQHIITSKPSCSQCLSIRNFAGNCKFFGLRSSSGILEITKPQYFGNRIFFHLHMTGRRHPLSHNPESYTPPVDPFTTELIILAYFTFKTNVLSECKTSYSVVDTSKITQKGRNI